MADRGWIEDEADRGIDVEDADESQPVEVKLRLDKSTQTLALGYRPESGADEQSFFLPSCVNHTHQKQVNCSCRIENKLEALLCDEVQSMTMIASVPFV